MVVGDEDRHRSPERRVRRRRRSRAPVPASHDAACRPATLRERVDQHGPEQDEAGDHELRPRRQAEEVHSVRDGADDEGPEERGDDTADSAEQAGAADHGGGDDQQQQLASTRVRGDRAQPRREHDAAHAGHEAADHEDGDADPVDVDPGAARRFGAAAHRVDVAAEARSRRDERPEDQEDDEDHDRVGHAAVLVAVPDRSERDEREPGDLEHDQREWLRRTGRWHAAGARC